MAGLAVQRWSCDSIHMVKPSSQTRIQGGGGGPAASPWASQGGATPPPEQKKSPIFSLFLETWVEKNINFLWEIYYYIYQNLKDKQNSLRLNTLLTYVSFLPSFSTFLSFLLFSYPVILINCYAPIFFSSFPLSSFHPHFLSFLLSSSLSFFHLPFFLSSILSFNYNTSDFLIKLLICKYNVSK